tara:strand:- start:54 stop:503 length:450 start_codon:yes stop_codon:yes gene_type:complete
MYAIPGNSHYNSIFQMEVHMIRYLIFIFSVFSVLQSQSNTGYDLLSDLENSNKNAVYTYWIGTVNGNIQGYEYGIWYALDYMMNNGIISVEEKEGLIKKFELILPNDFNEEDIFKVAWKFISKNPNYRHRELSELTHIAMKNKFKKIPD